MSSRNGCGMDGMEKLKAIANAIYPVLGVAFMAFMLGITGGAAVGVFYNGMRAS